MAHPNLWGTTDTRNGLPTTTRESPDFSHGECQWFEGVDTDDKGNMTYTEGDTTLVIKAVREKVYY
jgi:hypothetical protein